MLTLVLGERVRSGDRGVFAFEGEVLLRQGMCGTNDFFERFNLTYPVDDIGKSTLPVSISVSCVCKTCTLKKFSIDQYVYIYIYIGD